MLLRTVLSFLLRTWLLVLSSANAAVYKYASYSLPASARHPFAAGPSLSHAHSPGRPSARPRARPCVLLPVVDPGSPA